MDEIVINVFDEAVQITLDGVDADNYRFINESVFRYNFIKVLPKNIGIEDEWKRIDLVIHESDKHYPIEFKQYATRPLNRFDGKKCSFKGGAGEGNFSEFITSSK